MNRQRRSGVLLHVTSLPNRYGLGDFGPQAHEFVDFLAAAGQSVWQVLPLTPINSGAGNSPYSSYSAFAGNILFISPDLLVRQGLLQARDVREVPIFPPDRVDYALASSWRTRVLEQAFDNVFASLRRDAAFLRFCREESHWLDDYALFMALKEEHKGAPWYSWPRDLRLRQPAALEQARERLGYALLRERFFQYLFAQHWQALRDYAHGRDVRFLGDAPIYVSLDSSDVWSCQHLFELDAEGRPIFSAGAPPDYFSETGQMWGNPVYAWDRHSRDGYAWWIRRLTHESSRFDLIRLDHFRGFCAFWQVPACDPTAENGLWVPGPGAELFAAVEKKIPGLEIVAEDLGVITPDVVELMNNFDYPGMKVLQFAFSPDMAVNAYIPHRITPRSVVYTGTHDNNTTRGWYAEELGQDGRARLTDYTGQNVTEATVAEVLIRMALGSVAELCIIPLQDYLNLGREGRMNIPGQAGGNWGWRVPGERLSAELERQMLHLSQIYGRCL